MVADRGTWRGKVNSGVGGLRCEVPRARRKRAENPEVAVHCPGAGVSGAGRGCVFCESQHLQSERAGA